MNKLKLNVEKTKCMCINGELNVDIFMNNEKIEQVHEIKYLGIIIDKTLNFKSNLDYVCKKIARKVYFFKKIRNNIPFSCAMNIYNTIIKPHFEYCSSILYLNNNEMMKRLQILQNKAMRSILKVDRYTSKSVLLSSLNWLNVEQKIKINVLLIIFKIKYNLYPMYLTEKLKYVKDIHNYNLRNLQNFRLDMYKNEKAKNMLLYKGLNMFNSLPNDIKGETNINRFKKKIIEFVKDNV